MSEITMSLQREAQRIEEDSIHSAKAHFNAAQAWSNRHYWIGVPATVLSAVGGAAAVKSCPELAGVLAVVAAVLMGLLTFLKPSERASDHKTAGDQYLSLRNDARVFREIELLESADLSEKTTRLKTLSQRRNELNQGSPEIPRRAFDRAIKGISLGEASYKVDKEG